MTMNVEVKKSLGDKGEKAFVDLCNKFDCEFLHIKQDLDQFSSKMWRTGQKRPDFLLNIPDITSLFIDVKVREQKAAGERSVKLSDIPAFSVYFSDFQKMKELETRIHLSTWYAFFEKKNGSDIYKSPAYVIPLSRVEKHLPAHIKAKMAVGENNIGWEIRIPRKCMNEWISEIDLRDKCQLCTEKYCLEDPK
jgi:hypothetical protein